MFKKIFSSKENLSWFLLFALANLLLLASSGYLIYNLLLLVGVETAIRYAVIAFIVGINIFFFRKGLSLLIKPQKRKKNLIHIIIIFLLIVVLVIISLFINKAYNLLDSVHKESVIYSTSLVTMANNDIDNIKDVKKSKIGIISDKKSIEGYVISQNIIQKYKLDNSNELVNYDNFQELITNLYNGNVDYIFMPAKYVSMFINIDSFSNIKNITKSIYTQEKQYKKSDIEGHKESITTKIKMPSEPFTVLLLGIDSEYDGLEDNASFNGDSIILLTFNPKTLNATILSIPRDTYVPIACFSGQIENKITHSAWYGESCVIRTLQNLTGINIDYYVKINFKGVVSLVNALGGIEVDVPQRLCTSDSDRRGDICVNKGLQTLNGEEALVVSRDRYSLINGDIGRGLHQQLIMQGILNKAKTITSISKVNTILNTITKNMDTNMTTTQILGFYDVGKTIISSGLVANEKELIHMQQLYLDGLGQMIYDEGMGVVLWNYIPNKYSLEDNIEAMKINLGLIKPELIKEFSYSPNKPYEYPIIGEGPYAKRTSYKLLPSFIGQSKSYAQNWCNENRINVEFKTVPSTTTATGIIVDQNQPASKRVDKINSLVISVAEKTIVDTRIDCSSKENLNAKVCYVEDFSSSTKSKIETWAKKIANFIIKWEEVDGSLFGGAAPGTIIDQSIKETYIEDAKSITITIVKEKSEEEPEEADN